MLGFKIADIGPELVMVVDEPRLAAAIREFAYFWEENAAHRGDPAGDLARSFRLLKDLAPHLAEAQPSPVSAPKAAGRAQKKRQSRS